MPNGLNINSYANVTEGCQITYHVNDSQFVDFVFGDSPNTFDFGLDVGALRTLAELSTKALQEMASLAIQEAPEEHQDDSADARELVTTGERSA